MDGRIRTTEVFSTYVLHYDILKKLQEKLNIELEKHKMPKMLLVHFCALTLLVSNTQKDFKASDIARHLKRDPMSFTPVLDRLEKLGYLKRVKSEVDRRIVYVKPTQKALTLFEEITDISKSIFK